RLLAARGLHEGGPARGSPGRRTALRRSHRAPGRRRVREGAALAAETSRARLRGMQMARMDPSSVKALCFDVFGTVVDWRSSIIREGGAFGASIGTPVAWPAFADRWRAMNQPAMEQVRAGKRGWVKLDDLHRESLGKVAVEFGLKGVLAGDFDELNRAWHRLDPWPDTVQGLT